MSSPRHQLQCRVELIALEQNKPLDDVDQAGGRLRRIARLNDLCERLLEQVLSLLEPTQKVQVERSDGRLRQRGDEMARFMDERCGLPHELMGRQDIPVAQRGGTLGGCHGGTLEQALLGQQRQGDAGESARTLGVAPDGGSLRVGGGEVTCLGAALGFW